MEEHVSSSHCRRPSADILSRYLQQVTEAEHCRDEVIRVNALESKLVLVEIKKASSLLSFHLPIPINLRMLFPGCFQ